MWLKLHKQIFCAGIIFCEILFKHILAVSHVEHETGYLIFGRRQDGSLIKSIYQISLKQCLDECATHAQCQSINYFRRKLRCELNYGGSELSRAIGYVHHKTTSQKSLPCMQQSDPNQSTCPIAECPFLKEPNNGYIDGNMNRVGSKVIIGCDIGFVASYPVHVTLPLTSECQENGTWSKNTFDSCYEVTCHNLYQQGHLQESGLYTFRDHVTHRSVELFCDFRNMTAGLGYTYISPASLDNISSITGHRSENDHVIIRHVISTNEQKESIVRQLKQYEGKYDVVVFLSGHGGSAYNPPNVFDQITLDHPYLYLSFLPNMAVQQGTIQGYESCGNDVWFENSDGNKNNYIVLTPVQLSCKVNCCGFSPIARAFLDYYYVITVPSRQMPLYMYFETYGQGFGGGGTSSIKAFEGNGVKGIAFGLPFSL